MTRKELRDRVLELPPEERARLAQEIMASLDGPSEDNASAAWVSEIQRRAREVRMGIVKLVNWKNVRSRIRKRLSTKP
ncbi:MAG: addiction module protein [Planctomycetes bacterium]|nr:addiction module protein [Planctomycetota bacterium]